MSENNEGITPQAKLDSALDQVINDSTLNDKERDKALADIAAKEDEWHNEGKLGGKANTEVRTGAAKTEIFVARDGSVLSSAEDVIKYNQALGDNMRPGR